MQVPCECVDQWARSPIVDGTNGRVPAAARFRHPLRRCTPVPPLRFGRVRSVGRKAAGDRLYSPESEPDRNYGDISAAKHPDFFKPKSGWQKGALDF